MTLKNTVRQMADTTLIVTPRHLQYLALHGDDPYPPWVVKRIAAQMLKQPRDRSGSFSASASGGCQRAQMLQFLGKTPSPTGQVPSGLQAIFTDGKWRHLKWQADNLTAGIITDMEFSVRWGRKHAYGTMDGLGIVPDDHPNEEWRGELFATEYKGVNAFEYTKKVSQPHPDDDHMRQVSRYSLMTGIKLFSVIYENKSTQAFHEWVITPPKSYMDESLQELEDLNWHLERHELPQMLKPCRFHMGKVWEDCKFGGAGGTCEMANGWG